VSLGLPRRNYSQFFVNGRARCVPLPEKKNTEVGVKEEKEDTDQVTLEQ
jgi:hypothetical protein